MSGIKSETPAIYGAMQNDTSADDAVLLAASEIIDARFTRDFAPLDNPGKTQEYLKIKLGSLEHEVFVCLMLDNRHRVIVYRELFRGTLDGCSIYPREVVKQALADNAAAVIFAHNHPSGTAEPSQADIQITERLKKALALFDIRVLDHIIIGKETLCFSERGLI